jgi:hypothetical protein
VDGLNGNSVLKHLYVADNWISDRSFKKLSTITEQGNLLLKSFDASFNNLTHKSGVKFMQALAVNTSLKTLTLNDN